MRDHVHGRLDLTFEELGALNLKNITYPVEAFVWRGRMQPRPRRNLSSIVSYIYAGEALTLPDKPSIAVLPFQMIPPYAEKSWFAEGIVEDIIHMLASQREIFVISRGSTLQFSRAQIDLRAGCCSVGGSLSTARQCPWS